jgi:hypothetical protein
MNSDADNEIDELNDELYNIDEESPEPRIGTCDAGKPFD